MKRIQTRHLHEKTTPKASNWVSTAQPGALAVIPIMRRTYVKGLSIAENGDISTVKRSVDIYKPFMVQVWGDWVGVEPLTKAHTFCKEHGADIAVPDPDAMEE